jgi:hypothetical protein
LRRGGHCRSSKEIDARSGAGPQGENAGKAEAISPSPSLPAARKLAGYEPFAAPCERGTLTGAHSHSYVVMGDPDGAPPRRLSADRVHQWLAIQSGHARACLGHPGGRVDRCGGYVAQVVNGGQRRRGLAICPGNRNSASPAPLSRARPSWPSGAFHSSNFGEPISPDRSCAT